MIRHEARTQELAKEEKFPKFREWCESLGIKTQKQEYPACFGPDGLLVGLAAAKDLEANEVFVEIPESSVVNRATLLKTDYAPLLKKHPEIFDKHEEDDMTLVTFFLRERLRGKDSPWYYSMEIANMADMPYQWSEEEVNELQDKIMIGYIHQYKKQYNEDFEQTYKTFRDNKYDNYFPGISDPANYEKYKELYNWAFNCGMTRFGQKEFSLKLGTFLPWFENHNHKPYEDTLYRVLDPNGKVLREFTEELSLEPWGCPDFEYFYSRPLKEQTVRRRKYLHETNEVLDRLDVQSMGNVTQFDEAEKDHVPETYQILLQHPVKKGEQICFNYGRCNNRYWIICYGLAIVDNEYDAIPVHVEANGELKIVLLHKKSSLNSLLKLSKVQLESKGKSNPSDNEVAQNARQLLDASTERIFSKDQMTKENLDADRELFKKTNLPFRQWLALCHRLNLKEIYHTHLNALNSKI